MIVRLMPGKIQAIYLTAKDPGRKPPRAKPNVSCRGKDAQAGRVDPAATFHGITHEVATEIDCHKNKPVRKSQESPELKALLDDWEQRTGKTAPSRR